MASGVSALTTRNFRLSSPIPHHHRCSFMLETGAPRLDLSREVCQSTIVGSAAVGRGVHRVRRFEDPPAGDLRVAVLTAEHRRASAFQYRRSDNGGTAPPR